MKNGKRIWNKVLSLMLCLMMVSGMFAGMGMEAKAAAIPSAEQTANNGGSVSAYTHTWILTPGSTGSQFYDKVSKFKAGNYAVLDDLTYITTSRYGSDPNQGFFWKTDCNTKEFVDGVYWVYIFSDSYDGSRFVRVRYEHQITVRVRYSLGINISGAPAGGGITIGETNYGNGSVEVKNDTDLQFSVQSIEDYKSTVSFNGEIYTASNGIYTIPKDKVYSGNGKTIEVKYELKNPTTITVTNNDNANISFNGNTNSSQTVAKNGTYSISVTAKPGYIVTEILVDGVPVYTGKESSKSISWKPSASLHIISANVRAKRLIANEGKSINYREDFEKIDVAKAIFNAIYHSDSDIPLNSNMIKIGEGTSTGLCIEYQSGGNVWEYNIFHVPNFGTYDWTTGFGDEDNEKVRLCYKESNGQEYRSELVDLAVNKIKVTTNGEITKIYDGKPMFLSANVTDNMAFRCSGDVGGISELEIVGHYDSTTNTNALPSAPTEVGTYWVKVKATDSLGYNISDFIKYEIKQRPITITAQDQEIVYGNEIISNQNAVTVQGLLEGHNLTCAITQNTENVTTEGILTVEDVQIKSGNKDVTSNYQITTTSGKLMIKKIPQENLTILLPEGGIEYNGEEHKPLVIKIGNKTLTDNQDYKAVYSDNTKAGTATVTVTSSNWDGPITRTFKIVPKKITAAIINADEIYDGTSIAENAIIQLNGIVGDDDISVTSTISYADANAGESKKVTATNVQLTGSDAANYQLVDESGQPTKTLNGIGTISKRPITISAGNKNKAYGENDPELTWKVSSDMKVVEGEKLSGIQISRDEGEGVGEYQISVSQPVDANSNYDITFKNAKLAIGQKELTVIVKVDDKQYDDLVNASYSATLEGVVNNEEVTLNCENVTASFAQTAADEDIAVSLTGDFGLNGTDELLKNYKLTQPAKIGYTADIYNHYNASEYEVKPNSWTNESVSITAADGYLIALDNKNDSQWTTVLTYSDETELEGEKVTFYVRNDSKKWISLPETVTYYIDKTAPSGTIIIAENEFKTFLETITFGKFFNKTQTVIIEAEDSLSGIAQVEYYESAEGLTASQIENLPEGFWTEGKRVSVTLEDAKKFVYYARITDKAGNQICISSDGNVYDITNPAITGVVNGETYYTSQMVNVSDVNLETVTFNGETVTITDGKVEPIELKGNVNETYTIVATDKAGNTTEVTVAMKTISSLSDQLADITEENVTSDDVENIDEIQKIIADENQSNATENEKELLKKLLEKCDNLEKTLEKTKEVVKDAKDVVHKVTEGNVTLNEDAELKKAKDNLENILEKNKGNLTAKEQEEIQKTIDNLDAIIEVIDEVKDAVKAIKVAKSTDGEYGVPDNEAAVSAYERAKDGYDRLTEEQKAMLGSDVKKALKEAKAAITNYKMIEGNGKIWVHNTNGTVTFVGNGLVRKLKNVIIDGKVFSTENYHVSKGSTVVKVDAAALYRLGLGDHTFQMEYEDGKTDVVEFSIVTMEEWNAMLNQQSGSGKTGGVATGDSANILLWGTALILGAAGLVDANKKRKRIIKV